MWKKIVACLFIISCIGCGTKILDQNQSELTEEVYLRCNKTSHGNMAETTKQFFYLNEEVLYCINKDDIDNDGTMKYKRYVCEDKATALAEIIQKGEAIYTNSITLGGTIEIIEIFPDEDKSKVVYKVPIGQPIRTFRGIFMDQQFAFYYGYETNDGMYVNNIARLNHDGTIQVLFTEKVEMQNRNQLTMPASFQSVRGDLSVISSLLVEEGEAYLNVLWRITGDTPERIILSEDISIVNSYLSGNTFRYFQLNKGFYERNLKTGKEQLIWKNQLDYSRGYCLAEEYMVECNRYYGYRPDDPQLLIYNGTKWLNVELPEEVKKSDDAFYPVSVASDRIFFVQHSQEEHRLYYAMLDEKNPKLVCCLSIL